MFLSFVRVAGRFRRAVPTLLGDLVAVEVEGLDGLTKRGVTGEPQPVRTAGPNHRSPRRCFPRRSVVTGSFGVSGRRGGTEYSGRLGT